MSRKIRPGKPLDGQIAGLPGADLVSGGLADLKRGAVTENALLVLIASPRLKRLGIDVPARPDIPLPREHRLYELLEDKHGAGAHSQYNALIRRVVSFAHALESEINTETSCT